jgi:carbamoyl-phosphate synthase large subunit
MRTRNILIFPAGTEIGLEIHGALKHCKEVMLHGAGQDVPNHGRFVCSKYHVLPSIYENGWLPQLIKLVQRLEIDYIFPAYDDVIVALSEAAEQIPAAIISSPADACEITRSKSATYRRLGGKLRVPAVYESPDKIKNYPVLIKPDRGQGSQGVHRANTLDEVRDAVRNVVDPIICEYLPGEEYTIDCFSDRERGLLFAGARRRRRIRNGIAVNTVTEQLPEVWGIAETIGNELRLRGAWFFQLKRGADGELTLLEVAPRVAGAMAAHRVMGVNFPLLSIFEHERRPISILINDGEIELDRALCNRYRHSLDFKTAYIDLDDTLLVRDQVNLLVMKFVFHCINQGKVVRLITRHQFDLNETLRRHRLSGLFDEIIHIPNGAPKSSLVVGPNAIFIDDSFSERMDVAQRCRIPTFDASMLEMLTERAE